MRSAAREGARAHLLAMGMIYAMHIASPRLAHTVQVGAIQLG